MSSSKFEFLDLTEIGENDYQELLSIIDDQTAENCLITPDVPNLEDLKENDGETEDLEIIKDEEDNGFISLSKKESSVSGISFFIDGGTAEDVDPGKTPPMLSANDSPPLEVASAICQEDEEEEEEEEVVSIDHFNIYPSHTPQPPYMSQPQVMQQMHVHSVPNSGVHMYNMGHNYPPQSTSGGMPNALYSHLQQGPPPSHMLPHTVHIENCHVNLSPYGNPQPPGAIYATPPPPYQASPHSQVYSPYIVTDQTPMTMQVKQSHEKMDYDLHKRHDSHNRGAYRGRGGRGNRGRRRGRDDHERSNSVSSDHSSYSDSGGKPHYKDNGPPPPLPPNHYPMYHQYHPYPIGPYHQVNALTRPTQGMSIIAHQYSYDPYSNHPAHVMPYPTHTPVSLALISHENSGHIPSHTECDQLNMPPNQIQEQHVEVQQQQVASITSHSTYIVTTSQVNSSQVDSGCHYTYSPIDNEVVNSSLQNTGNASVAPQCFTTSQYEQDLVVNVELDAAVETLEDPENKGIDDLAKPLKESPEKEINDLSKDLTDNKLDDKVPEQNCKESTDLESSLPFKTIEKPDNFENPEIFEKPINQPDIESSHQNNQYDDSHLTIQLKSTKTNKNIQNNGQQKNQRIDTKSNHKIQSTEAPVLKNQSVKNQSKIQQENGQSKKFNSSHSPVNSGDYSPIFINQNSVVPSSTTKEISFSCSVSSVLSSKVHNQKKNSSHTKEDSSSYSVSSQASAVSSSCVSQTPVTAITNKSHNVSEHKESRNSNSSETKQKLKSESFTPASSFEKSVLVSTNVDHKKPQDATPTIPAQRQTLDVSPVEICDPTVEPLKTSLPVEAAWGQKKSWSQLFKPNDDSNKQIAYVSPFNAQEEDKIANSKIIMGKENGQSAFTDSDIDKAKVGALLKKYIQDYRPVLLQPRGLINKNYWCYVNAPLQALLACPSLYQLMQVLSKEAGYKTGNIATPFINSIVDFGAEFCSMPPVIKPGRKEKKDTEVVTGVPFEPTCVYKMLTNCKENQFTEGRQQDAEEMLSFLLNGLHDEMVESLKLVGGSTTNGTVNGDKENSDHELSEDDNEWKVQGPKKKSCVTRTAHFHPSPISKIFWGRLRSVLQHAGGNATANLQPFNTLPLDIQSPKVDSIKDALSQLVMREDISGYTCPKTNQEVNASNQVMFEDLPRVLILQLKRFIYDKDGGLQKVTKRLQFQIDLEITKDLISNNSRGKFNALQRRFKLFAVVNHEGKEATKGHYVADVYHSGYNCWLRYDDSNVKAIPENVVLRHEPPRVPYLLFYRRSDTLSSPPSSNINSSSSNNNSGTSNKSKT